MKKFFVLFFILIFTTSCKQKESEIVNDAPNTNPLEITGYHIYDDNDVVDGNENLQLLASIDAFAQAKDDYLSTLNILSFDENYILIEYETTNIQPSPYEEMEGIEYEKSLALLSAKDYSILKKKTLPDGAYVQKNRESIIVDSYNINGTLLTSYDYSLKEIGSFTLPADATGLFSGNGKICYYMSDQKLYGYNTENAVCKELKADINYLVNSISGIVTDQTGQEYLVFYATAPDYNDYQFILNTTTEKIIWTDPMTDKVSTTSNDIYMEYNFDNTYYYICSAPEKACSLEWNGSGMNHSCYILKEQDLLFTNTSGEQLEIYLYDLETLKLLGYTTFSVTGMKSSKEDLEKNKFYEEIEPSFAEVSFYDSPVYMSEDSLLLHLVNYVGEHFFIEWDFEIEENTSKEQLTLSEYQMGTRHTVDLSSVNNPLYVPDELSPELQPLREKADELEEKYKVDIYIGEECGNMIGGYVVEPLTGYHSIELALYELDSEMERYPINFFSQFRYSWLDGLDIYLAGSLTGTSGENLSVAGGFQTEYDSNVLLVIDCQYLSDMSTFHHELSHAIDDKIINTMYSLEEPYFSEEKWASFNPSENMYTLNYNQFGYDEYMDYAYYNRIWVDGVVENTCFIDSYSMTYPTEDRATLFEAVMMNELDLNTTPYLKLKMEYYAECIRETFVTAEWDEAVPWEVN